MRRSERMFGRTCSLSCYLCLFGLLFIGGCRTYLPMSSTPPTATINTPLSLTPLIGIAAATEAISPTPLCVADLNTLATRYTLSSTIDMTTHTATVTLTTVYRNETGVALPRIVFNIPPANRAQVFTLTHFNTSDQIENYVLNGARLDVLLQNPLQIHCAIMITMAFDIKVPQMPEGAFKRMGYLGYSDRQLNLGDWLPLVAPFNVGDWIVPRDWPNVGEVTMAEASSYEADVTVENANLDHLMIAGPGTVTHKDATSWHFSLDHARSFSLSISEHFIRQSIQTADGITIELYTFATLPTTKYPGPDAATDVLTTARDAVTRFEELFGPCSYQRLVIVQGDFFDGMEFSGLVFIGGSWFTGYVGTPDSWLTILTAHELSHQWWYSRVGNNQGQTPYLDEAFATYSELLYLEKAHPDLVKWWWTFRIKNYQPKGFVDSTVYEFPAERQYINAVYLRGVLMLNDVRGAIGDLAFMNWLHDYATTLTDQIATPLSVWKLLSPTDYVQTVAIRTEYLHNPDPASEGVVTPAATAIATTVATPNVVGVLVTSNFRLLKSAQPMLH